MTVFILTGFIKGVPYDLEEAAAIDGCSPEGTFFKIILPLLTPVITTVTILNGMWIWNDYLLPSLMLGQNGKVKTLPVAVQAFVGSYVKQWDLILTAALLAIIPMVVIFLIGQKQIMNGMVEGAIACTVYAYLLKWLKEAVPKPGAASFLKKPRSQGQNIVIVRLRTYEESVWTGRTGDARDQRPEHAGVSQYFDSDLLYSDSDGRRVPRGNALCDHGDDRG